MVSMNQQQAEAFIEHVRSVLEKRNNPPLEDAARILAFADGLSLDYVQVRRHTTQELAVAITEGFLAGRVNMTPPTRAQDDDD